MPSANLQIVDAPAPATWAEARKLVAQVRSGARAWLQLGEVLEELRSQYFDEGRTAGLKRGTVQPARAPHDAAHGEPGWQAKVREELGISDDTARRWMLDGQRYRQLLQITDGAVKEVDGKKVTAEVVENAKAALAEIAEDPSSRPARKWAGVWGAGATKGKHRAPVDHARNIRRGLVALATSLEHWNDLPAEERVQIENGWREIVEAGLIPSTWRRL